MDQGGLMKQPNQREAFESYGGLNKDMMFKLFNLLSIVDLLNCRLVCKTWKTMTLNNTVWERHILRFERFYPSFRLEFTQQYKKQKNIEGGQLLEEPAPKRRKPGKSRKTLPKKKEITPDGYWKGLRSFLRKNRRTEMGNALMFALFKDVFDVFKKNPLHLSINAIDVSIEPGQQYRDVYLTEWIELKVRNQHNIYRIRVQHNLRRFLLDDSVVFMVHAAIGLNNVLTPGIISNLIEYINNIEY